MPTSGQMTKAVAKSLGVPEATVNIYVRHLREAGLIRKAGRGRGAAKMALLDFARLIISLLTTDSPARAVAGVSDFGVMRNARKSLNSKHKDLTLEGVFAPALDHEHTFEDAVAALVYGFCDPTIFHRISTFRSDIEPLGQMLPGIFVRVYESKGFAEINLSGNAYYYEHPTTLLLIRLGTGTLPSNAKDLTEGQRDELMRNKNVYDEYAEFRGRWSRGLRVTREISSEELVNLANEIV